MTPLIISSLAIIIFSALIHASFQLSLSVLTLLSSNSLGKKSSHTKTLRLMNAFTFGVLILTALLLSTITYYLGMFINHAASSEQLIASSTSGLMIGLGIAVWAVYYRRGRGTSLWLPRSFAKYLTERAQATKNSAESFSLGMASVVAELIFIIGPILAASLAVISLPNLTWQLVGIGMYLVLSLIGLLIMTISVGSGHSVAQLQQWRETHKRFLQFVAGTSLMILAGFIIVDRVLGLVVYGGF